MKNNRTFIRFALALLFVAILIPSQAQAMPKAGDPTPNFKVVTTSGQSVSNENYRGYVLVIDFFATWCIPCKHSIPHLVEMNRKYGKQGLQILGMSADEDGDKDVREFIEQYRINYPVALAGESIQTDFGIRSVPVMFVVDKKGKVAGKFQGFNDEIGRSMEQLIKKLMSEK